MRKSSKSVSPVSASTPSVEAVGRIILTSVATPLAASLPENSVALYCGGVKLPQSATFPSAADGSPMRWITSTGWGPATQEEWDLVRKTRHTDPREAAIGRRAFAQAFLGRLGASAAIVPWGMGDAVEKLFERLSSGATIVLGGFGYADVRDIRSLVLFHLTQRTKRPFSIWRNDGSSLGPVGAGIIPAIASFWEIQS